MTPLVVDASVWVAAADASDPFSGRSREVEIVDWYLHRVCDELSAPLTDSITPIPPS